MQFKEPYQLAMMERGPRMYQYLLSTGALDKHLQAKSVEAHQLYEQLTENAEKGPTGYQ